LGVALVAVCWPLDWLLPGLRTHLLFFPLWLGFILTVDALGFVRDGSSLATRSPRSFALLFVASIPVWWLFELLNLRVGNWRYPGRELFGPMESFLLSSLSYSTVIPAVFVTAELVGGARWIRGLRERRRLAVTPRLRAGLALTGLAMLALLLAWPRYFYPFLWTSLLLLLDVLAHRLGRPSILRLLERGDWRSPVALALGALTCGFFWELWNLHSYPKWTYHIPYLGFWKVFEMPLLGYLGYLPFGVSLYPLAHLILSRASDPQLGAQRTEPST
jgi:hypothetical protein